MSDHESISVKVVLMGEPAVGKTSLRLNFVGSELAGDYMMTLGADIAEKKIVLNDRVSLNAQIWDLAGQENFDPLTRQFLQGTQGAIVVFDLTRDYTFDKVNMWLEKLHEENRHMENNIPFIIVGNKEDLESYIKVDDEVVQTFIEYVNRHQVFSKTETIYIKTSAKTGSRVKEAFKRLGEILIRNFEEAEGRQILGSSEVVYEETEENFEEETPVEEQIEESQEVPITSEVSERIVENINEKIKQEPVTLEPEAQEPIMGEQQIEDNLEQSIEEFPTSDLSFGVISEQPKEEVKSEDPDQSTRSISGPPQASFTAPKPVLSPERSSEKQETSKDTSPLSGIPRASISAPKPIIENEVISEQEEKLKTEPSLTNIPQAKFTAPVPKMSSNQDDSKESKEQEETPTLAPPIAKIETPVKQEVTFDDTPSFTPPPQATINDSAEKQVAPSLEVAKVEEIPIVDQTPKLQKSEEVLTPIPVVEEPTVPVEKDDATAVEDTIPTPTNAPTPKIISEPPKVQSMENKSDELDLSHIPRPVPATNEPESSNIIQPSQDIVETQKPIISSEDTASDEHTTHPQSEIAVIEDDKPKEAEEKESVDEAFDRVLEPMKLDRRKLTKIEEPDLKIKDKKKKGKFRRFFRR